MSREKGLSRGSLLHRLARFYVVGFHDVTILSDCPLPRSGPALLVSNHISGLDPVVYQSLCPRRIVWMMASEYYEMKTLRWFYRAVDAIPVHRNNRDTAAVRAALRKLAEGEVVGLFPEGRIGSEGEVLPFQNGVAMLALKSGAPVYPAFIEGTSRGADMLDSFLYPHRLYVAFGPAIVPDAGQRHQDRLDRTANLIHEAVRSLRQHLPRGEKVVEKS